jgi:hypothetical protein
MTHPITPPPELVVGWADTIYQQTEDDDQRDLYVATRAAQWGADQELEACCGLLVQQGFDLVDYLHAARRPKPPSLKEQALGAMGRFTTNAHTHADEMMRDFDIIRRALEQLDD